MSTKVQGRLLLYGAQTLSDAELVAVLFRTARAADRAQALMARVGGPQGLALALAGELMDCPGVGASTAAVLCAAMELGRRMGQPDLVYGMPLRRPSDVERYLRGHLGQAQQEEFWVLGLDARQRLRLVRRVGIGSLSHVDVHPREVFRPLIRSAVHSVILAHNHPSQDAQPSDADVDLTARLADVGRLVGIPVLDTLVITRDRAVSLASLGVVPGL